MPRGDHLAAKWGRADVNHFRRSFAFLVKRYHISRAHGTSGPMGDKRRDASNGFGSVPYRELWPRPSVLTGLTHVLVAENGSAGGGVMELFIYQVYFFNVMDGTAGEG